MKRTHLTFIEPLEARIAPASLDVLSGSLIYNANPGEQNFLSISIVGGNYVLTDGGETINLGAQAMIAGFTGSGTGTVTGPNVAVNSMVINLGDADDQLVINALTDPLTLDAGTGADTLITFGNLTLTGTFSTNAETVQLTGTITATTVSIVADSFADFGPGAVNIVATNLSIDVLGGIGSAADAIETNVTNLEARSGTGGIFIDNFGTGVPLNIGGVQLGPNGLTVTFAGDIVLTSDTSIHIQGFSGEIVRTPSGNVSVTASGATADIQTGGNSGDRIDSDAGDVFLKAGRDVLLGSLTTGFGDIEATGNLTIEAGHDIVVTRNTFVDTHGATGALTLDAVGNISILQTGSTGSRLSTEGGTLRLGAAAVVLDGNNTTAALRTTTLGGNGDIFITADAVDITAGDRIIAGTGAVTIQTLGDATSIALGSTDVAGVLGLVDAELDLISAGLLRIGRTGGADIGVSEAISPALTSTLSLRSSGKITDNGAGALQVANLAVDASNANPFADITVVLDGANHQVGTLAGRTSSAIFEFAFRNSSPLTIGTVDGIVGISAPNVGVRLTADDLAIAAGITTESESPLTVEPFTAGRTIRLGTEVAGSLSITQAELDFVSAGAIRIGSDTSGAFVVSGPVNADTLSLFSGGTITQAAGANLTIDELRTRSVADTVLSQPGNDVDFLAAEITGAGGFTFTDADGFVVVTVDGGDGISTADGSVTLTTLDGSVSLARPIVAGTAGNTITITAAGGIVDQGTVTASLTATNLALSASTGIASIGEPLEFTASNLEVSTINGGIFLTGVGGIALNIGGTSGAFDGVQVTGTGDIILVNDASIILAGSNADDIRTASGNVFVQATGETSNIETRNGSGNAIDSDNGSVTLNAGQDILIGSAATDKSGRLVANGSIQLTAGRDITLDDNGDIDVSGSGTITGNAGRNFSILASDGTSGSIIDTQGGRIDITTGEGGIFTSTNGSLNSLRTTNPGGSGDGRISIIADQFVLGNGIDAGTGRFILAPFTGSTEIHLGAEVAGTLSLTDAELDFITAGGITFGDFITAGTVSIDAPISPGGTPTLLIATAGPINTTGTGSITIANLALITSSGIGTVTPLATSVSNLAFLNFDVDNPVLGVAITNTGPLTLTPLDGISDPVSQGPVTLTAPSIAIADGVDYRLNGTLAGPTTVLAGGILGGTTTTTALTFTPGASFNPDLLNNNGLLTVNGPVALGGGTLALEGPFPQPPGTVHTLITNDGTDPVTGTFAGLPEGAIIPTGGQAYRISYIGGTGNDVTLTTLDPDLRFSADKRSAFYTEADGDKVTVTVSKGKLSKADFTLVIAGTLGGSQLRILNLSDDGTEFKNANVTIKAVTPAGLMGDGFADIGYLDSTGFDLGKVKISGDLAAIAVGDFNSKKPAVLKFKAGSLGQQGLSALPSGFTLFSNFNGDVPSLTVKRGIENGNIQVFGKLTTATITGGIIVTDPNPFGNVAGTIFSAKSIGTLTIDGDFLGGAPLSGIIADRTIGTLTITGSLTSPDPARPVVISAYGGKNPVATGGIDLTIGTLTIGGNVANALIQAGVALSGTVNADASIGTVKVGGNFTTSSIQAGTQAGTDGFIGTADDEKINSPEQRDVAGVFSRIAKIVITGQVFGTDSITTDSFGIVAEQIVSAKVNGLTLTLDPGERDAADAFSPTTTGPGPNGETTDFAIREITG